MQCTTQVIRTFAIRFWTSRQCATRRRRCHCADAFGKSSANCIVQASRRIELIWVYIYDATRAVLNYYGQKMRPGQDAYVRMTLVREIRHCVRFTHVDMRLHCPFDTSRSWRTTITVREPRNLAKTQLRTKSFPARPHFRPVEQRKITNNCGRQSCVSIWRAASEIKPYFARPRQRNSYEMSHKSLQKMKQNIASTRAAPAVRFYTQPTPNWGRTKPALQPYAQRHMWTEQSGTSTHGYGLLEMLIDASVYGFHRLSQSS